MGHGKYTYCVGHLTGWFGKRGNSSFDRRKIMKN